MSFILRKVYKDHTENNTILGDNYSFVHREYNYDEFNKAFEACFEKNHVADDDTTSDNFTKNTYAFILSKDGSVITPLYKKQGNYIMTEGGKTFANLTYK